MPPREHPQIPNQRGDPGPKFLAVLFLNDDPNGIRATKPFCGSGHISKCQPSLNWEYLDFWRWGVRRLPGGSGWRLGGM